jgi:hypothetical protein
VSSLVKQVPDASGTATRPDRDGVAVAGVFGCKKFHKFMTKKYGTIESDHKPLEIILRKPMISAPMSIKKMMLKLQPYEFRPVYVKGKYLGLADCLCRLPLPETCQSRHRCIDGSRKCSTKPLSLLLTTLLTAIKESLQRYCSTA